MLVFTYVAIMYIHVTAQNLGTDTRHQHISVFFYTVINEFWSYTSVCIVSACTCMVLRFLYIMIIVCTILLNEVTLAV